MLNFHRLWYFYREIEWSMCRAQFFLANAKRDAQNWVPIEWPNQIVLMWRSSYSAGFRRFNRRGLAACHKTRRGFWFGKKWHALEPKQQRMPVDSNHNRQCEKRKLPQCTPQRLRGGRYQCSTQTGLNERAFIVKMIDPCDQAFMAPLASLMPSLANISVTQANAPPCSGKRPSPWSTS